MRIKSYFAQSVHEAMQKARFELGPEALLLSSKKALQPESAGAYEVVFGVSNENRPEPVSSVVSSVSPDTGVAQQLAELRKQIENVQRSLSVQTQTSSVNGTPEAVASLDRLLAAGFSLAFAQELAECARLRGASGEPTAVDPQLPARVKARPRAAATRKRSGKSASSEDGTDCRMESLLDEIDSRFSVAPELGLANADRRVVLLVGPPGAGKTTTLVKLAVAQGAARKVPVQILSTDTLRVGGAEQLHAYSRILGASFQAVSGRRMLDQAVEECHPKKLVLIDSPGFGPADLQEAEDLSGFVEQHAHIDIHLVLPATAQASAIRAAFDRFRIFRPSKLIFTHMDETDSPAPLLETAVRSGVPISFVANGQQIPEDLAEASKLELRRTLSAQLNESAAAAA